MLLAQAAEQSHDLVWIALIGAVQVLVLAWIAFLTTKNNKTLNENTKLTAETHRLANGSYSILLNKTAQLAEEKAAVTGTTADRAVAADVRAASDAKKADLAEIGATKKKNGDTGTPHIDTH